MQFLIEEALLARLDAHHARENREATERAAIAAAEKRMSDHLAKARGPLQ